MDDYGGMRILRQDPWECLVAYICSQNNKIERITEIVDKLASFYGEPRTLDGVKLNSFPSPERLAEVDEKELEGLRLGLSRERRIHAVARDVAEDNLDLDALTRLPYLMVRGGLMSYEGIGPKIADCVCLFALDKGEAFPVDRHIENGLEAHYGMSYTAGAKNARLMQWTREQVRFQRRLRRSTAVSRATREGRLTTVAGRYLPRTAATASPTATSRCSPSEARGLSWTTPRAASSSPTMAA